ncbi:hypothetical protein ACN47E_001428 [Coniothyrium glycines]
MHVSVALGTQAELLAAGEVKTLVDATVLDDIDNGMLRTADADSVLEKVDDCVLVTDEGSVLELRKECVLEIKGCVLNAGDDSALDTKVKLSLEVEGRAVLDVADDEVDTAKEDDDGTESEDVDADVDADADDDEGNIEDVGTSEGEDEDMIELEDDCAAPVANVVVPLLAEDTALLGTADKDGETSITKEETEGTVVDNDIRTTDEDS